MGFHGETTIRLAAKLYETRDAVKFMLGERYAEHMADLAGVIRDIMAKSPQGKNELQVSAELAKAPGLNPHQRLAIIAAGVEMAEPSLVTPEAHGDENT